MRSRQLAVGNWQLVVFVTCYLLSASCALAATIKTYVGSGTGFFVSSQGHIVTNAHVVPYCMRLTISGRSGTREAAVVARDAANDLALLKTNVSGAPIAAFSSFKTPLAKGDRAVVVGFPGASTDPVTRESEITRTEVPGERGKWLALENVLEQGNSGGPLFDTSGNVIGVVSARAELMTYNKATREEISHEDFGAAIAAPVVEKFLNKSGVRYRVADSDLYLPSEHIAEAAREFIVKVRCEYKTEVR